MMLESSACAIMMQVPHQVMLAVILHAMTENVILHSPADIDGINLHKTQVFQRMLRAGEASIQACGETHELAG